MGPTYVRWGLASLVAILIGYGVPVVELWWNCRQPVSEACVWGKAYLILSFTFWGVARLMAGAVLLYLTRFTKPRSKTL